MDISLTSYRREWSAISHISALWTLSRYYLYSTIPTGGTTIKPPRRRLIGRYIRIALRPNLEPMIRSACDPPRPHQTLLLINGNPNLNSIARRYQNAKNTGFGMLTWEGRAHHLRYRSSTPPFFSHQPPLTPSTGQKRNRNEDPVLGSCLAVRTGAGWWASPGYTY